MNSTGIAPDFDSVAPFGTYRPRPMDRRLINLCHHLPVIGPLQQVGLLIRRPLKYRLQTPVDMAVWGLNLRLLPRGNISESRLLFVPQFFDRIERDSLRRFLTPGCVFIDIGANAGAYSFWVYSLFREDCTIYAVEPDPDLTQRIEFNRRTNGAVNLHVFPCALSDTRGMSLLNRCGVNKGTNRLAGTPGTDKQVDLVAVRVTTLFDLILEAGIKKIDALKIDIEGHDRRVLDHFFARASKDLWPRMIVCEIATSEEQVLLKDSLLKRGYVQGPKTRLNQIVYLDTAKVGGAGNTPAEAA